MLYVVDTQSAAINFDEDSNALPGLLNVKDLAIFLGVLHLRLFLLFPTKTCFCDRSGPDDFVSSIWAGRGSGFGFASRYFLTAFCINRLKAFKK